MITKKHQFFLWLLVLIALSVAIYFFVKDHDQKRIRESDPSIVTGPWGTLQTWNIRLEVPPEYADFHKINHDETIWHSGLTTLPTLQQLLISCGLTQDQVDKLLATRSNQTDGTIILKPDNETLLSISPEARSSLYLELSKIPLNDAEANPFYIPNGDVAGIFKGTSLENSSDLIGLVSKLVYPRNGFTYFSDLSFLLVLYKNDPEKIQEIEKSFLSTSAVMARLLVKPTDDVELPIIYWGLPMPGVKIKDLRPLFDAQKQLPDGGSIPVSFLLSPLARDSLYKTPLIPKNGEKLPDCHWTALNFFNFHPDDRMSDPKFSSKFITENYYEISNPSICTDLELLFTPDGKCIHSATYLAGDLVYSKNGIDFMQPWVLLHQKDMVGMFSALQPVAVHYFRKNDY